MTVYVVSRVYWHEGECVEGVAATVKAAMEIAERDRKFTEPWQPHEKSGSFTRRVDEGMGQEVEIEPWELRT